MGVGGGVGSTIFPKKHQALSFQRVNARTAELCEAGKGLTPHNVHKVWSAQKRICLRKHIEMTLCALPGDVLKMQVQI